MQVWGALLNGFCDGLKYISRQKHPTTRGHKYHLHIIRILQHSHHIYDRQYVASFNLGVLRYWTNYKFESLRRNNDRQQNIYLTGSRAAGGFRDFCCLVLSITVLCDTIQLLVLRDRYMFNNMVPIVANRSRCVRPGAQRSVTIIDMTINF